MQKLSVELTHIDLSLGNKQVLAIPQLSIYQWDRIGIVGDNGQGKSTLLNLLGGNLEPDKGKVEIKTNFGFFQQVAEPEGDPSDYELLSKLKVPKRSNDGLSGGELTRMKLAQVLSTCHEGLLLDEPTTHLDQEGVNFLVNELSYYYGTLVIVSHDRYFLDRAVTKIWEVSEGHVTEYQGNYTDYQQQKDGAQQTALNVLNNSQKEKRRLELAVAGKKARAEKMSKVSQKQKKRQIKPSRLGGSKQKDTALKGVQKAAKGIEKRLSQLSIGPVIPSEKVITFQQSKQTEIHNKYPIIGESVTLIKGERLLLNETNFQFPLGEVIALQGPNGCGKSSLLAHILARGPGMTISPKVNFGTFEQQAYQIKDSQNLVNYLLKVTDYSESIVRSVLHQLGFTQGDLLKKVYQLSGGEKTRLILGRLFLQESNVLVLDEPTNFIDLSSRLALESFIKNYPGTILLTSHDRYFVESVATQIWVFRDQSLILA